MAKARRVFEIAKEIGVESKVIVDKCTAEGVPGITSRMSVVKPGLEVTIREWFSESHRVTMSVESAEKVDLTKVVRARLRKKTDGAGEQLIELRVHNFRSLADISLTVGPLNVFFGPNGAGKSSLLDTIWFVRDCAIRSVELASLSRSHGIGLLYDGADLAEPVSISLATEDAEYQLQLGVSSGRIEPFAGERLEVRESHVVLIDRPVGSDKAMFYHAKMREPVAVSLREPEKLSLGRYLDFEDSIVAADGVSRLLQYVHFYHSRSFELYRIKQQGSEVGHERWLWERAGNVWSVLRNLHDRQSIDPGYDTVMRFMKEAFPSFDGLVLEQVGPSMVYASFLERGRRSPIRASGVSDGHMQFLLLMTALFSERPDFQSLLLFDEPDISLHPWALAVFAKAAQLATREWRRQIFIATHSPVLLSQFSASEIVAAELEAGRTRFRRLSEMKEMADLLEQYGAGPLYMSETIAKQSESQPVSLDGGA